MKTGKGMESSRWDALRFGDDAPLGAGPRRTHAIKDAPTGSDLRRVAGFGVWDDRDFSCGDGEHCARRRHFVEAPAVAHRNAAWRAARPDFLLISGRRHRRRY